MDSAYDTQIHTQNVIACVWDFDRTLIPGNMQQPIFEAYGIDTDTFWEEVNALPEIYANRGIRVSEDTLYLNHLLTYIKKGALKGLNNHKLRELGEKLEFLPGLPAFFEELKKIPANEPAYRAHDIELEHYIVSNGLAEIIRGSKIAPYVENVYGCEFIEDPCPPGFRKQTELTIPTAPEIRQIGSIVDNTIKTRFIFEINKGCNKNPEISVNASMRTDDRRIPIKNMLYIADGPSDVPVFSVVTRGNGKTYAVYRRGNQKGFAQNDNLLRAGRILAYGPADYTEESSTSMWLKMHVADICDRIVHDRENALNSRITRPPGHLRDDPTPGKDAEGEDKSDSHQEELFGS